MWPILAALRWRGMPEFDTVIVGAGPAGTIAAAALARGGARVALLDVAHPREKPCGGGVTGRALQLVGALPAEAAGRAVRDVIFEAAGHRASVPMPDLGALKVYAREDFDAALLRDAVAAGAAHIRARATHFSREGSRWTIATQPPAGNIDRPSTGPVTATWLIGADGAGGIVRKRVFRPFERRHLSIAAGSYVDGVEASEIVIRFVDRPQGYLWSFPRPGHLAVGTCAQADETTTAEMHAITDRWLDAYAPAAGRPRRRYAWPIPSLSASDVDREEPSGDGWMLLGDAAGLVDPITREGIFFALRSGQLAADAILGSAPAARSYAAAVRDELHAELRRAARLKAGFFTPRFTGLLVDALKRSPAIRAVMVDLVAGRQPYAGLKRRLLSTFEIGLMMRVVIGRRIRRARER
ncbi:MAG TPA: NAD(P)/FAD-dependent oxidoreductase [Vicinamibacterales bacterium]|nr:NAD(P)/FAD-dependent oxidoreductase [Vicinamibacterales bacterium]